MKNVMILIPTLSGGGAERLVTDLAKYLDKKKWTVYLVSLYSIEYANKTYLTELNGEEIRLLFLNKRRGIDLAVLKKLYILVKTYKIDIIHTHLYACCYGYLVGGLLHKKIIHTVHNLAEKELPRSHQIVIKFAYKRDKVVPVAISLAVKRSIFDVYKIPLKSIETVYNGIDLEKYSLKHSEEEDRIQYISIGRLSKQKNFEMLLKAFSQVIRELPQCKLLILGKGELRTNLEEIIRAYKLEENVELAGEVSHVACFLQNSDIFVLSSLYEGFGLVIVEAMASGLPVVATKVGAIPEIVINEENGYLVEPGDVDGLASAMTELGKNKNMRRGMGERASHQAQKFDVREMTRNYEHLYENL